MFKNSKIDRIIYNWYENFGILINSVFNYYCLVLVIAVSFNGNVGSGHSL